MGIFKKAKKIVKNSFTLKGKLQAIKSTSKDIYGQNGVIKNVLGEDIGGALIDTGVAVATGGVGLAVKKGLELQNRQENSDARKAQEAKLAQAKADKLAQAEIAKVQAEKTAQEQAVAQEQAKLKAETDAQALMNGIKEKRRLKRSQAVRTVFGGGNTTSAGMNTGTGMFA